ncbi:MAG: GGDEF domain-containing protein [Gammaproteobacteria bacterium]|nr:GGDEF domain-containing protein [Gammaproteobacteria bacterium]
MLKLFRTFFLLLITCCSTLAHATAVFVIDADLQQQDLAPYLVALEDSVGTLTIEEARRQFAAGSFTPIDSKKGFNKGYTHSAWWIAFQVQTRAEKPQIGTPWLLELAFPTLDSVELYHPRADSPSRAGDIYPFSERPMRHLNFVFPMPPATVAVETIFLRLKSQGTLTAPLTAWSPERFAASSQLKYAGQAAYFGALLAMIIYNALLWITLRERIYIDYVLYATFIGLGIGAANGMAAEFFWPDNGWLVNYSYWAFGFAGIFVTQFARSFLNTAATSIWLDRSLLGAGILVAIPTFIGLFVSYYTGGRLVSAALFIALMVSAWSGIYSVIHKIPGGRLYLLSWFLFLLFAALYPLRNYGLVPTTFFTVHGIQIGSLAEMLLLSFALAARINHIRAEKVKAQREAIEAQATLVTTLRESERVLEEQVAKRTMQLEEANRRLNRLSVTDALTGIANRRHFDTVLKDEWKRMERLKQPLAVAMIDIDWFKKYNDRYGHQAGDICLTTVAQTLAASISRAGDLVARYGGEEFAFIAPAIDAEDALVMAQKICNAIAAKGLPHAESPFAHVTASIGVAAIVPAANRSSEMLLKLADEALYRAKEAGRNQAMMQQNAGTM